MLHLSTSKIASAPLLLLALTFGGQAHASQECEDDADCGEYLTCLAPSPSNCVDDGNGLACDEPAPDAASHCGIAVSSCDSDEDCPREFECITSQSSCPDIACEQGAPDCRPCEETSSRVCQPKETSCTTDADCPEAWTCVPNGDAPVSDLPATIEDRQPPPTEEGPRSCLPEAWGGGETDGGEPTLTDDLDSAAAENGVDSQAGAGCSVSANASGGPGGWTILLLPLLAFMGWRRRSLVS